MAHARTGANPAGERQVQRLCAGGFKSLEKRDIRALVDDRSEKVGKKIREAELDKVPYMLIVGGDEAENGTVAVRKQARKGMWEA